MIKFGQKLNTEDCNIWITSDLHLDHGNILHFCQKTRPFKNTNQMNNTLIEEWNSKVSHDDYIIHLGDFCFKGSDVTTKFLQMLNGKKILILGNHDKALRNNIAPKEYGIVWKGDYLELQVDKQKVVLSHYPMTTWNGCHRGAIQLYGHCHGSLPEQKGRQTDVGYDSRGKIENLKDIIREVNKKEIFTPDHH